MNSMVLLSYEFFLLSRPLLKENLSVDRDTKILRESFV